MLVAKRTDELTIGNTFTFDIDLKTRKLFEFIRYSKNKTVINCIDKEASKPCEIHIKNQKFVFVLKK